MPEVVYSEGLADGLPCAISIAEAGGGACIPDVQEGGVWASARYRSPSSARSRPWRGRLSQTTLASCRRRCAMSGRWSMAVA
jgi:hypothetical protein